MHLDIPYRAAAYRSLHAASTLIATSIVFLFEIGGNPNGASADIGLVPASFAEPARLRVCKPDSNCVSSSPLEPPNRYISPLTIVNNRDVAYERAVRDLSARSPAEAKELGGRGESRARFADTIPSDYYIHLTVPGTAPGSMDDIELFFPSGGGIVNLRCEARVTLPPPPFCIRLGCINGNMDQRNRLEVISRQLGLPSADQKRMREGAKWTPIFFNSDTIPGFYDDLSEYN